MNEAAVSRAVRDVLREVAPLRRDVDHPRLHVRIAEPTAKVILLPGRFRGDDYIKRHVSYVVAMDAECGEQHVRRNLSALRQNLEEMGLDQITIDAEVRRVEAAVRAELWRQVLTPDNQQ